VLTCEHVFRLMSTRPLVQISTLMPTALRCRVLSQQIPETARGVVRFCVVQCRLHVLFCSDVGFADWRERGVVGVRPTMMRFFLTAQVSVTPAAVFGTEHGLYFRFAREIAHHTISARE
jgi:hypothetical protein